MEDELTLKAAEDARLLDAARDMLEALKRADRWIASVMTEEFGWPVERVSEPPEGSHLHAIRAAIAKAEGKQ